MSEVVLSGVASEYVLGDLADYLRERGHRVHEFDFANFKGDAVAALKSLDGRQCTYITSAHTNLTKSVAEVLVPLFVKHYPNYLGPLDFMGILRPRRSIYVPHDLLTPFGDENLNEIRYFDLYDHIISPFPAPALQAVVGSRTQVLTAGWIKHAKVNPTAAQQNATTSITGVTQSRAPTVALFISMIEHLRWRHGDQGVYDYFKPLLNHNVYVKLPAWQGVEAIEDLFNQNTHCHVFPSIGNSIDLIHSVDIVICNGASSIHAEANLLGRPAICLLDDEGVTVSEQQRKLAHLPNVYFHDYRKRSPVPTDLLSQLVKMNPPQTTPTFDFGLVEALIVNPAWDDVQNSDLDTL